MCITIRDNHAFIHLQEIFKLRFHQLGRDEINLEGLRVEQLNQRIQRNGTSCGIYSLMVWMIMNPKLPYVYNCIMHVVIAIYV